jgi:hypothetical protein
MPVYYWHAFPAIPQLNKAMYKLNSELPIAPILSGHSVRFILFQSSLMSVKCQTCKFLSAGLLCATSIMWNSGRTAALSGSQKRSSVGLLPVLLERDDEQLPLLQVRWAELGIIYPLDHLSEYHDPGAAAIRLAHGPAGPAEQRINDLIGRLGFAQSVRKQCRRPRFQELA